MSFASRRFRILSKDGTSVVEKLPAWEDFSPEQMAAAEVQVALYCRVSTLSEMQEESSLFHVDEYPR